MRLLTVLSAAVALLAVSATAKEPGAEPKTLLLLRGKLLHEEAFAKDMASSWLKNKGKWEIVDGAMRGMELKADMHAGANRMPLTGTALVFHYQFKLDGVKQTTFSINRDGGHLCRVVLQPTGFQVKKDNYKKDKNDKAEVLDTVEVPIKAGEWHTIVIEIQGKEMLACLDGKHIAFGMHEKLGAPVTTVGFTVTGDGSASFKNLRIWEGTANPAWAGTKAKLLADRKPASK